MDESMESEQGESVDSSESQKSDSNSIDPEVSGNFEKKIRSILNKVSEGNIEPMFK